MRLSLFTKIVLAVFVIGFLLIIGVFAWQLAKEKEVSNSLVQVSLDEVLKLDIPQSYTINYSYGEEENVTLTVYRNQDRILIHQVFDSLNMIAQEVKSYSIEGKYYVCAKDRESIWYCSISLPEGYLSFKFFTPFNSLNPLTAKQAISSYKDSSQLEYLKFKGDELINGILAHCFEVKFSTDLPIPLPYPFCIHSDSFLVLREGDIKVRELIFEEVAEKVFAFPSDALLEQDFEKILQLTFAHHQS